MKSHIRRSLIVCWVGLVVALAAYAGQTGYPDDLAARDIGRLPEVRQLELNGVALSYRMGMTADGDEGFPSTGYDEVRPRGSLKLFVSLTDPKSGQPIENAQIYLTAVTPTGQEVRAIAQKMAWGYRTTLDNSYSGRYEVEVQGKAGQYFFEDRFCQDNQ